MYPWSLPLWPPDICLSVVGCGIINPVNQASQYACSSIIPYCTESGLGHALRYQKVWHKQKLSKQLYSRAFPCNVLISSFVEAQSTSLRIQFSTVVQSCPTLCDPMDCSTPGLPVHHQLPEFTQTHVHWVSDTIQPSHLLSSPSPPAFNLSQHQGLFTWVISSHQVAKVLEVQLQCQSFQWTLRTDLF